ncbi:MAG: DUF1565 domain-containing protein [Verrucomicrobiota bacterium]|nr:DUF1565 domain-containing protein [Verrucomicrobiota bacterium]
MKLPMPILCLATAMFFAAPLPAQQASRYQSHPPLRPLPQASSRPFAPGPGHYVDAAKGNDTNDGSAEKPWKTLSHAVKQLEPGDTLYLRGGTYYERVYLTESGEPGKPITIRSYPGEIATLDGGLREFHEDPVNAWEPVPGGAPAEYISRKVYPEFDTRRIETSHIDNGHEPFYISESSRPLVLGFFGDSMVPLHGYRTLAELRAPEDGVRRRGEAGGKGGAYNGPGAWYDRKSGRIHIRLAHTQTKGAPNYRGETDPRKVPMVIAGGYGEDVLRIKGIKHLRLQDMVMRGATGSARINLYGSDDLEFDHLTVYGGAPAILVKSTMNFRVVHCAFRGLASPWESRASMKYWGTPGYVIMTHQTNPWSQDWEFAHNEFTDGHDFFWMRYVKNLKFHHNFVDNFNDDGLEFGPKTRDQEIDVYQNLISRCQLLFSAHEIAKDESPLDADPKSGVYIYRNVIDLRRGIYHGHPQDTDSPAHFDDGELCSDHGGPAWPQYFVYHNTILKRGPGKQNSYGFDIGTRGVGRSKRRVFNNIFVQLEQPPAPKKPGKKKLGVNLTLRQEPSKVDLQLDGNLFWILEDPASVQESFFAFRRTPAFEESKKVYEPGWTAQDLFGDPQFRSFPKSGTELSDLDLGLQEGSPAVNSGLTLPAEWPDPLRDRDKDKPDRGAIPRGVSPWAVGVDGMIAICP